MILDILIGICYIKCIKGIEKPEKKRKGDYHERTSSSTRKNKEHTQSNG